MLFDPGSHEIRLEWGARGLDALRSTCDVLIVVDVLSFATALDVATARGGEILPYAALAGSQEADGLEDAADVAKRCGAELAGARGSGARFTLSPASFEDIERGTRVLLPSPNGGALCRMGGDDALLLAGCLRNAAAVAAEAAKLGQHIGVIAAGERWPDGSLRPCLEDWLGAGAILSHLQGDRSPECDAAVAAFEQARDQLPVALTGCGSGRELIARGCPHDLRLAARLDVSACAPLLVGDCFIDNAR